MLPPNPLSQTCNQTLIVNSSFLYISTFNNSYLVCSSGLTTYIVNSVFLSKRDYCVLVQLLPCLTIHDPDIFLYFWDRGTALQSRPKKEPITAIILAVILGLGAKGAGTGIASLVTSNKQYAQLSTTINKDIQELQRGLKNLKDSVVSLSEVVLENRRGLDLLFLLQGGLCIVLKEECCFYSDKTGLVEDSLKKVQDSIEERKRLREQAESWYQNWFSTSPWLSTLLPSILGPMVEFFILISFRPWAFQKLTRFIKSQIDAILKKPLLVHYHHLEALDSELPENNEKPHSPKGLDFSGLEHRTS
ncbi:Envelope glycoprotein [Cricetulus griseus]|uniref:Envelope glycoprotein n=1 Tax=Cricetulus griseus TaxID=10029 RepID=G3IAZ8_CRIGR|nr:Envelope glycoprotein [Cricetulus griseus]